MDPEVRVFNDLEHLSLAAAQLFYDQAEQAVRERGRFLAALNGGSTPQRLFQLIGDEKSNKIDWKRTHLFWGDERCVPTDDIESSYGQARKLLLDRVNIPDENVHRVKGELGPVEAAMDYALTLKAYASSPSAWPRFDLVLLGMGEDGHTASLFPGSPVEAPGPTLAVTAHYQDRPAHRVTLTPSVFNSARLIIFMAVGGNKASTLSKVLNGKYEPELYPAQRIDPIDGSLIWLVDTAAADKLQRRLLKGEGFGRMDSVSKNSRSNDGNN
jgi:6-phosphogluconolactonase